MKNLTSSLLRNIVTAITVLVSTIGAVAQTGDIHLNETNPAMRIGVKDGMLQLTCRSGCAWTDLSFTLVPGKTQLVTEYGMSSGEAEIRNPELSNFLMSVKKNKQGDITIKNIEGMNFKKIKFNSGRNGALVLTPKKINREAN